MTDVWEIIDTTVKIGLGATISGFLAYQIAKLNHDRVNDKEKGERKRQIIEDIAEEFEVFYFSAEKFQKGVLIAFEDVAFFRRTPEESEADLHELFQPVQSAKVLMVRMETKALLIGASRLADQIRSLIRFVESKEDVDLALGYDQALQAYEYLINGREKVLRELSEAYNR